MISKLQQKIMNHMEKNNISIHAIEKRSGLKRGAISNIIRGTSKNPSADTLVSISNFLDCSLDELIEREHTEKKESSFLEENKKSLSNTKWEANLFIEAVNVVEKELNRKLISNLNLDRALIAINEVYTYSLNKNNGQIDKNFAEWLVSKL